MGRWKTRREERRITARSIHARLMANVPTFTTYTTRRRCAAHGAQVRGRQASAGATENIKGAIVITQQKFIAELRMLRTRAKEVGLPIAANMIGRAIEVCESERDPGLFFESRPRRIGVEKGGHESNENSLHLPRRYVDP